jgi:hypothetical protein
MVDQLEVRLQLHRCGYSPLPLIGKAPVFKNWPQRTDTSEREIQRWEWLYPSATNTGVVTRTTPTLDLDIMNEEAVHAAEEMVRVKMKHRGAVLERIGNWPKRAVPFKTADEPFRKIRVLFEGDEKEKVEFLCDGQQAAVAGIHPDTGQPYRWLGRELWQVPREDLPGIGEDEARQLVSEIVEMLCREFGYRVQKTSAGTTHDVSSSNLQHDVSSSRAPTASSRDGRERWKGWVPLPVYKKITGMMEPGGLDQSRVRGILKPVAQARQNRNETCYRAALQFRELINANIISRVDVEELLFMCMEHNGYVRDKERGAEKARATIKSGLDALRYGYQNS